MTSPLHWIQDFDSIQTLLPPGDLGTRLARRIRQIIWRRSRLPCPPDSAGLARMLLEDPTLPPLGEPGRQAITALPTRLGLCSLTLHRRFDSQDGSTSRLLLQTLGGELIEAVIMRYPKNRPERPLNSLSPPDPGDLETGRCTVCISSQTGCALGCRFCATASLGGGRNLEAREILEQVWLASRLLEAEGLTLRNVVFMGMGEPLLNYQAVCQAVVRLMDPGFFSLSKRRITISTAGIPPEISRLGQDLPGIGLAVSLHSCRQEIRETLMPVARRWSLEEVRDSLVDFQLASGKSRHKIIIEYLLFGGLNDRPEDALALVQWLEGLRAEVNLLGWNPHPDDQDDQKLGPGLQPSTLGDTTSFRQILKAGGISSTLRRPMGPDIAAACGQLVRSTGPGPRPGSQDRPSPHPPG